RVFILQKIRSIAVLKCVGASSRQVMGVYVLQVMALGLAGSLLGVAIARAAIAAIPFALGPSSSLLAQAHYGVSWSAAAQVGAIVCVGFAGLALVLQLAGRGLVALVTPLANSRSFPLRHAVLHLSRRGNQTRVILLAVGLGAFFIVGVRSLQATLLDEFSVQVSNESPDMFLLDVQRGQVDGVRAFLSDPANA